MLRKPLIEPKISEIIKVLFLFTLFVNQVISGVFKIAGINSDYLSITLCVTYLVLFILYILLNAKNKTIAFVVLGVTLVLFILSFVRNNILSFVESDFMYTLFICLPTLFVFCSGVNEKTYKYITILSYVSGLFFVLLLTVDSFFVKVINSLDYQLISYVLIVPILLCIQIKKNAFNCVLLFAMLFYMVFYGGRGPLVCIFGYLVYYLVLRTKKKPILKAIVLVFSILVLLNYKNIMLFIATEAEKIGLEGGLLMSLKYGDLFSNHGRDEIYSFSLDLINLKWLFGYGVYADRIELMAIGRSYPHNVFLELAIQYGIPFASIIVAIIVIAFLRNTFTLVKDKQDIYIKIFELLFFSNGFAILLFSSSYLISPAFFALSGIIINKLFAIKNENNSSKLRLRALF